MADSEVGYRLSFDKGKPASEVAAVATNVGTIVTARELFHNYGQRKNALQSAHQEYGLIHEIVSLYTLNNLPVAFTLTKVGGEPDLKAVPGVSLTQRIRMVIGPKVASNLTDFHVANLNPKYAAAGVIGDLSSCLKTYRFVFFVNGRLVDCYPLKKSLETVYRTSLPKGSCAFVMLSLTIDPANVDVNIHPTKKEVRFLYEDEIVGQITAELEQVSCFHLPRLVFLLSLIHVAPPVLSPDLHHQVLTYSKQSNLTTSGSKTPANNSVHSLKLKETDARSASTKTLTTTLRQCTLVREDHRAQKIDDSFRRQQARNEVGQASTRRTFKLLSLTELKAAVIHESDKKLRTIFEESSLIGCLNSDRALALVQYHQYLLQVRLHFASINR